jgi:hypothetical protein
VVVDSWGSQKKVEKGGRVLTGCPAPVKIGTISNAFKWIP